MAFTDLEKDCLRDYHAYLVRKGALTFEQKADLDTILVGDETAKRGAIKTFIESHAKPGVDAALSIIDTEKTDLQTKQTDLQAWLDANP